MPPSQTPPLARKLQLALDNHDFLQGSLEGARTQAAELRALHAAVRSMHHLHSPKQHHDHNEGKVHHYQSDRSSGWSHAGNMFPTPYCRASPSYVVRPHGNEYPIFTPTFEEENTFDDTRNSVDSCEFLMPDERLSYILDKSQRTFSTLGAGESRCSYPSNIRPSRDQDSRQMMEPKPILEINLAAPTRTEARKTGESRRKAKDSWASEQSLSCGIKCARTPPSKTVVPLVNSRDLGPNQMYTTVPSPILPAGSTNSTLRSWFSRVKKKESAPGVCIKTPTNYEASAMDLMELKLSNANRSRDAAKNEAMEVKLEMEAMAGKVAKLEHYCKRLREELFIMNSRYEYDEGGETPRCIEFHQAVSEARAELKHVSMGLMDHLQEDKLGFFNRRSPCSSSSSSFSSLDNEEEGAGNAALVLEALVQKIFFQHFENVAFEKNGAYSNARPVHPSMLAASSYRVYLSYARDRHKAASSDPGLRRFCSKKIAQLNRALRLRHDASWPDEVAQAFRVAARSVWMVHLLALSFSHTIHVSILRIAHGTTFDEHFMEEVAPISGGHVNRRQTRVKLMVMPGFLIGHSVIKCHVVCR